MNPWCFVRTAGGTTVYYWASRADRSAMIGLFDIAGLSSSSPSSSYRRYSTPLVQGHEMSIFQFNFADRNLQSQGVKPLLLARPEGQGTPSPTQ